MRAMGEVNNVGNTHVKVSHYQHNVSGSMRGQQTKTTDVTLNESRRWADMDVKYKTVTVT